MVRIGRLVIFVFFSPAREGDSKKGGVEISAGIFSRRQINLPFCDGSVTKFGVIIAESSVGWLANVADCHLVPAGGGADVEWCLFV